jgi:hypothetical protein
MTSRHPQVPAPTTELRLEGEHDLSALQTLADPQELTTLALHDWQGSDLSPLAGLTQLTSLTLWNCPHVRDLGPLAHLQALSPRSAWECAQECVT